MKMKKYQKYITQKNRASMTVFHVVMVRHANLPDVRFIIRR